MKTTQAIEHFGSATALAVALEVTKQAVSQWGECVPEGQAYKLQVITGGKLRVDPACYKHNGRDVRP